MKVIIMPENNGNELQTIQTEIINFIADICGINNIGLPSGTEDTSICFDGGRCKKRYMDGSELSETDLRIIKKSGDQFKAAESIWNICNTVSGVHTHDISEKNKRNVYFISVKEPPSLISEQDNRTWVYSCKISVRCYSAIKNRKGSIKLK